MNQHLQRLYSSFTVKDLENPITAQSIVESSDNLIKDYYGIQDEDVSRICGSCLTPEEHKSSTFPIVCKDCKYILHPEDRREKMDDGSVLCEDCTNDAEQAAMADWQMKESTQRS